MKTLEWFFRESQSKNEIRKMERNLNLFNTTLELHFGTFDNQMDDVVGSSSTVTKKERKKAIRKMEEEEWTRIPKKCTTIFSFGFSRLLSLSWSSSAPRKKPRDSKRVNPR